MDEKSAWEYFSRTGSVQDYLAYAQCRANPGSAQPRQEDQHENGRPGPGGFGEANG